MGAKHGAEQSTRVSGTLCEGMRGMGVGRMSENKSVPTVTSVGHYYILKPSLSAARFHSLLEGICQQLYVY